MTMASNEQNLVEEVKPPDPRNSSDEETTNAAPAVVLRTADAAQNCNLLNANLETLTYIKRNAAKETKSQSCRESLVTRRSTDHLRRPNSVESAGSSQNVVDNNYKSWRKSYHKDVEEALSSLLWEPYECRQQSATQTSGGDLNIWTMNDQSSFSSDISSSISSTSSCNSLCEIETCCASTGGASCGIRESFTDDFLSRTNSNRHCSDFGSKLVSEFGNHSKRPTQQYNNNRIMSSNMTTSFTDDFTTVHEEQQNKEDNTPIATTSGNVGGDPNNVECCGMVSNPGNIPRAQVQEVGVGQSVDLQRSRGEERIRRNQLKCAVGACAGVSAGGLDSVKSEVEPYVRRDVALLLLCTCGKCSSSVASNSSGCCLIDCCERDLKQQCSDSDYSNAETNTMRLSVPSSSVSSSATSPPLVPSRGVVQVPPNHARNNNNNNVVVSTTRTDENKNNNNTLPNPLGLPPNSDGSNGTEPNPNQVGLGIIPTHPRTNSGVQIMQPNRIQVTSAGTQVANISGTVPIHVRSNSQNGSGGVQPAVPNRIQIPPNVIARNTTTGGGQLLLPNRIQVPSSSASSPPVLPNRVQISTSSNNLPFQHTRESSVPVQSSPRSGGGGSTFLNQNIVHTRVPSLPNNLNQSANESNSAIVNNSVNVVSCYRAVPVNVVSNVPTIQCLNSSESSNGNNVSNVHIVQAMPPAQCKVQENSTDVQQVSGAGSEGGGGSAPARARTFTSTEAQTDDTGIGMVLNSGGTQPLQQPSQPPQQGGTNMNREQRRRERRERRHQRRLINGTTHQHSQWTNLNADNNNQVSNVDRLPDILNSHLPPPYSTLPMGMPPPGNPPPPPPTVVPMVANPMVPIAVPNQMMQFTQVPLVQGSSPSVPVPVVPVSTSSGGLRFQFQNAVGIRRSRRNGGSAYGSDERPKSCCGLLLTQTVSIRWFIVMIAFVGVCCVVVGTVLGAMKASGRDHLTVSLLMIGVGIVLVTVSGVAWRLTSHDAPTCRAMLGLGGSDDGTGGGGGDSCTRRFVPRLPPSYGRPHHPYAAMMYPEFQYRPPPPSYQASMQEYRLRLLLLDRHAPVMAPGGQHAVTPPPTYRSNSGSLLRAPLSNRRDATQSEYSCPPSYRSRTSSNRPNLDPGGGGTTTVNGGTDHSREQSISLSDSNGSVVNVVSILTNQVGDDSIENISLDNIKVVPDAEIAPLRMLLKSASENNIDGEMTKDGNLVTIVQTGSDQGSVIVTVSGSHMSSSTTANTSGAQLTEVNSEMEILAHL